MQLAQILCHHLTTHGKTGRSNRCVLIRVNKKIYKKLLTNTSGMCVLVILGTLNM